MNPTLAFDFPIYIEIFKAILWKFKRFYERYFSPVSSEKIKHIVVLLKKIF